MIPMLAKNRLIPNSLIVLAIIASSGGCRSIRNIGESRNSMAARRISRQGIQAMQQGRTEVAEQLFSNALEISDSDDRAHRGMAESLWQQNKQVEAIAHMEQAVMLSAGDPKLILRLGEMYHEVGRIREADQKSREALAADQSSAQAWSLRGKCLLATRQYEDALAAYHQALAIQPDFHEAQFQTAEIYRIQGRYDRLLATLDCSSESLPTNETPARTDVLRAIALQELGRPTDSLKSLESAVQKDPQNVETRLMIASASLQSGNLELAEESIAIANQLDPAAVKRGEWIRHLQASQNRLASATTNEIR